MITIAAFLGAFLLVYGAYNFISASRESTRGEIKRRLRSLAMRQPTDEAMPSILKEEILSDIPRLNVLLYRLPFTSALENLIEQTDSKMKVGTLLLVTLVSGGAGFLLGIITRRGIVVALVAAIAIGSVPILNMVRKKNVRKRKFVEQFPDALDMIARSLRAGHTLLSAMLIVAQEMPDPVASTFRTAYDEQNLGLSLSEALSNMTRRISSVDLTFFVTAVTIQRETGGNLAEILEKLGMTIRERFKILGQLKIYTAQGRLSGYILSALPLCLALILMVINPSYISLLVKYQLGIYMVVAAVVLQIIGFFVIRKIINIKI